MNASTATRLHQAGTLLALLTLVWGFCMGGAFGAFEHGIKDHLSASAEAAAPDVYAGDEGKKKKVTSKAWVYFKRSHLHGNGIGAAALAVCVLLGTLTRAPAALRGLAALGMGLGGLGYSVYWMLAALKASGMGSTGAAKEALDWLAIPSAGLATLGLFGGLAAYVLHTFMSKPAPEAAEPVAE